MHPLLVVMEDVKIRLRQCAVINGAPLHSLTVAIDKQSSGNTTDESHGRSEPCCAGRVSSLMFEEQLTQVFFSM